jgi:hypothetical protein
LDEMPAVVTVRALEDAAVRVGCDDATAPWALDDSPATASGAMMATAALWATLVFSVGNMYCYLEKLRGEDFLSKARFCTQLSVLREIRGTVPSIPKICPT